MENKEISVYQEKIKGMAEMVENTKVETEEDYSGLSDKIKTVKTMLKFFEQEQDKLVAPAKQIIAEAKTKYDSFINECKKAEIDLKRKGISYLDEAEAKRKAEEIKITAKVETGYIKPETAVDKLEKLPEVQKSVSTISGSSLGARKVPTPKIVNPELVPKEFWIIDEVKVRREALERHKAGAEQIPGVVVEMLTNLNSR